MDSSLAASPFAVDTWMQSRQWMFSCIRRQQREYEWQETELKSLNPKSWMDPWKRHTVWNGLSNGKPSAKCWRTLA
jgi:hypothetical protein